MDRNRQEVVRGWCCGCRWEVEVQEKEVVGGWCRCCCRRWEVEVQGGAPAPAGLEEEVEEVEGEEAGLQHRGRCSTSQAWPRNTCSNS